MGLLDLGDSPEEGSGRMEQPRGEVLVDHVDDGDAWRVDVGDGASPGGSPGGGDGSSDGDDNEAADEDDDDGFLASDGLSESQLRKGRLSDMEGSSQSGGRGAGSDDDDDLANLQAFPGDRCAVRWTEHAVVYCFYFFLLQRQQP